MMWKLSVSEPAWPAAELCTVLFLNKSPFKCCFPIWKRVDVIFFFLLLELCKASISPGRTPLPSRLRLAWDLMLTHTRIGFSLHSVGGGRGLGRMEVIDLSPK